MALLMYRLLYAQGLFYIVTWKAAIQIDFLSKQYNLYKRFSVYENAAGIF